MKSFKVISHEIILSLILHNLHIPLPEQLEAIGISASLKKLNRSLARSGSL